jgi:hypothetical protein
MIWYIPGADRPEQVFSIRTIQLPRRIFMDNVILVFIILGALLITAVTIAIVVYKAVKRNRAKSTTQSGHLLDIGASGEKTFDGITYHYKHFRGTDKAPPYFTVTIPCTSTGEFSIKPETKFDRFFKKLGICVELETHDRDFDDTFFITTDSIPFTRSFLERQENRQSIQALFKLGFNYLKHDGKTITATWRNFPRRTHMEVDRMEKAVAELSTPYRNIPKITIYESMEPSSPWRAKRLFAFAFSILIAVTGTAAMIAMLTGYKPLDPDKIFVQSLKFSIPLFIVFTWLSLQLLKGRSSSHRELIAVFFIALAGFPVAGFGYMGFLNAVWDNNPPAVHEVMVNEKYYSKHKNSYSYYALVDSWREGETTEKLSISRNFFNRLQPGSSTITITTKPGKFGYEWIVDFH